MSLASRCSWPGVALAVACGLVAACGSDDGGATGSTNDGGAQPDSGAGTGDAGTASDGAASDGGGGQGPTDAGAEGGLPPGAACAVDMDAGEMVSTSCQDNPALPTCFQCVDLTENGQLDGICAYTCRMGQQDCPQGQTCTAGSNAQRTSYQPCRNVTDGYELGYCR